MNDWWASNINIWLKWEGVCMCIQRGIRVHLHVGNNEPSIWCMRNQLLHQEEASFVHEGMVAREQWGALT